MVVVGNQQVESESSHGSGGNTSSINEVERPNNASTEAEMQRLMIRLYRKVMIHADFEDDNSHGAGGSTSSINELPRLSVSTEAELELMMRIYKETICPMILADINAKKQLFLSLIREICGMGLLMSMTCRNFNNTASTSGSQALQLQFLNGISTPVSTRMNIEGRNHKSFVVALVEGISGKIVTTGAAAAMEVEIVVLKGDCNNDETENWTSDKFNNKIVSNWNGKKVLQGNTSLNLKEGIVSIDISFTHNSAWKGKRNFRLGAKAVDVVIGNSVKEAITESFVVRDKRTLLYNKHEIPSLSDPVYRLNKVSHRGDCFKCLSKANIKTVMDLLTFHAINPKRLKDVLKVHPNTWKAIMDHAKMCKDDKGLYLYHYPRDGQKRDGVVFNIYGKLVGLITESQFVSSEKLPDDKKADAQNVVKSSLEYWEEVVSFKDEASLMNHVQSGTTLNSLHNGLRVVLPQTTDRHANTSLISPQVSAPTFPTNIVNKWGHDSVGLASQNQSPKRPASVHSISNSPKKPRDDHHPLLSPSTPSVGSSSSMPNMNLTGALNQCQTPNNYLEDIAEDEDYMQYLNLLQFDRWRMVWCLVGWISVFSKVRKR